MTRLKIPNRIVTKRLNIRPHTPDDADDFVEFMTDDVATRFLNFEPEQRTADGAKGLLDYVIASYRTEEPVFALAITERSNGAYLGSCGLSALADEEGVECYFWLLPKYWGWGYASEAIRALLYFAVVELKAAKVVTNIPGDNTRAIAVAEGAGFSHDGPARLKQMPTGERYVMTDGQYVRLYGQEG